MAGSDSLVGNSEEKEAYTTPSLSILVPHPESQSRGEMNLRIFTREVQDAINRVLAQRVCRNQAADEDEVHN